MSIRPRPTSRDVAERAGVSQATVSLVLRDRWRGRVSPARVEAVRAAVAELGYRPNLAARSLRLGRARTALVVVPALTNEFFARMYAGAARVAAGEDVGVVLYVPPDERGPAPDPFASAGAAVDGVLASSMAAESLATLSQGGLPLVMLDSEPRGPGTATVNPDIADGTRQVARHLLGLGHRRFAHLAAEVDSWTFRVRARVLAEELAAVPGARLVAAERAPITVRGGLGAAERVLAGARGKAGPTALVCDDDLLAVGACKAARRLGLRVPEELSVTGFDDLTVATAVEPELTTVALPAEDLGAAGMHALLALLAGTSPATTVLPAALLPRASTAPPPPGP
ncbi:LacI family DNA-binding transcriptional regulator [Streptomyces sp. DSM 44917]|uniref:LacI family DNA-binding transcriptional regulator n=1 Tax=Streptomyces boetiae TaxID=3075541 RepID=A0ABU2L321_9ACTN|nr:LacI family DNA-binding transcriptional regulator [Streptomyces sp. DSM 44917]MDT0305965.1 LacI family DNA-binding transcriptional regulator [Streptomyces sp. DSM 44917]